jgi:hypothetical protein
MRKCDVMRLAHAAIEVVRANKEFRDQMPRDWEGDPLQDAVEALQKALEKLNL